MSSKRDYEAVAKMIERELDKTSTASSTPAVQAVTRLACDLSDHFAQHNPAFNRDRFMQAAGLAE